MNRCYFFLNAFLVISLVLLSSCNQQKIEDLQRQNGSLEKQTSEFQKNIGELQDKLNTARDSIYSLQLKLNKYENPPEKIFAFAAVEYTYTIGTSNYVSDSKNYNSVSDIKTCNYLDEEAKYRWLDDLSNSISKEGTTLSNYSINKRKIYTFNNYVTASQKRAEVLKFGIQD